MIKNEKGITLISLAITVIVIIILTTVGIKSVSYNVQEYRESRIRSELSIVRQFIIEQYEKAKATNTLEKQFGQSQNSLLQQEIWNEGKTIVFPDNKSINVAAQYTLIDNNKIIRPKVNDDYEQVSAYYILSPNNLPELGFSNVKDTYIVNYKTGEVYNISRLDSEGRIQYYLPEIVTEDEEETAKEERKNTEDFSDWDGNTDSNPEGNGD